MKQCPNPECPQARKFGRPTEYRDTASTCSDCGADLVPLDAQPASTPGRPTPTDAVSRLALSVGAFVLAAVGTQIPLFGAHLSVFGRGELDPMPLLPFGLVPFIEALLLVELGALVSPGLRRIREGSTQARAPLRLAAFVLGIGFLCIQTSAALELHRSAGTPLPSDLSAWAQLLIAHVLLFALATQVSRRGLGSGLLVVQLGTGVGTLWGALERLVTAVRAEAMTLGAALVLLMTLAGAVTFLVIQSKRSRRPAGQGPAQLPVSLAPLTILKWVFAGVGSLQAFSWLGLDAVAHWLHSSMAGYYGVAAFLAFDAVLLMAWLQARPAKVAVLWKHWLPDADLTTLRLQVRALIPGALRTSLIVCVGLPLLMPVVSVLLGTEASLGAAATIMGALLPAALLVLDLSEEFDARRRLGLMAPVLELHRVCEVEAVMTRLRARGVEAYAQAAAWRGAMQFFGPEAPVMILVPEGSRAEAERALRV